MSLISIIKFFISSLPFRTWFYCVTVKLIHRIHNSLSDNLRERSFRRYCRFVVVVKCIIIQEMSLKNHILKMIEDSIANFSLCKSINRYQNLYFNSIHLGGICLQQDDADQRHEKILNSNKWKNEIFKLPNEILHKTDTTENSNSNSVKKIDKKLRLYIVL